MLPCLSIYQPEAPIAATATPLCESRHRITHHCGFLYEVGRLCGKIGTLQDDLGFLVRIIAGASFDIDYTPRDLSVYGQTTPGLGGEYKGTYSLKRYSSMNLVYFHGKLVLDPLDLSAESVCQPSIGSYIGGLTVKSCLILLN